MTDINSNDAPAPRLRSLHGSSGFIPTSSEEWLPYFAANAAEQIEIPWELGAQVSELELAEIRPSLQAWQLGESSDGAHLMKAARSYASLTGDAMFIEVARMFIKEEQRHGAMLGTFLDLAGTGRIKKNWGDTAFRAVRYAVPSMEVWATPVIMVETIALLYYKAIREATKSCVLRAICTQILRDEVPHIRFQYERLAILHRHRSKVSRLAIHLLQRLLFTGVCCAVWLGHRRAFKAGGFTMFRFWSSAWRKMNFGWARMNPDRYDWGLPQLDGPQQLSPSEAV